MKVNVYDLAHLMSQKTGEKFDGFSEKNAIIIGKDKFILTDNEAVHTVHRKDGVIKMMPLPYNGKDIELTFDDITLRGIPVDEVELGIFVRTFSNRIEANYNSLLKSIQEIGLNSNDYPRKPANDK